MAKQPVDVGVKFTGDASGFQKAAANVKGSFQSMKKDTDEIAGAFDDLGGAIGGVGGEMASTISSLASATSAIGAMVVIVGALAKAWQRSQENIDLYLKSADKLAAGSAGFDLDAEKARVDTRRRANGMIQEGLRIEAEYMSKLTTFKALYTDEQKESFARLVIEGRQMKANGEALRASVTGMKDREVWEIKYRDLLKEEEELKDRVKGIDEVRWEGLEAELAKQRLIGKQAEDAETAEKARNEANRIANILLTEKNGVIDEQVSLITRIAEMTGTQEVVEDQLFELQKQKTSNQKEYYQDLIKIDRLMQNGVKLSKENLADMKDFYSHDSLGYKSKAIEISPRAAGRAVAPSKSLGIATPGIQKYGGTTLEQIQAIVEENKFQATLEGVRGMVSSLENTFAGMFMTISSGSDRAFQDMAKAFGRSLQQMAAQMAAKAAIFGILNILSGGTGGIAQIATGLLGGQNLGSFLGFGGGMKGTNRVQVGVTGTISGSNINLSNSRFGNELTRNS